MKLEEPEPFQPEFAKPGKLVKGKIKNKYARRHDIEKPKADHCIRCKKPLPTLRIAHYEGMFKSKYGKGTGVKSIDDLVSLLCYECDQIMATKPDRNDQYAIKDFEIEWAWLIIEYKILLN